MKKLTAGIFATLLAVVSVSAAHAEIASKGYVDQQVGTKADASAVSSLQGIVSGHTTQIGTINDTIGGYGDIVTHDVSEFATSAQGAKADTAVQPSAIANVERTTNKTTTLSAESTDAQYPSAKAVYDTIQAETSDIASSGDLSALTTRVGTLETASATHATKTELAGKQDTIAGAQLEALNSGITADKVEAYDGYAAQISGKLDTTGTAAKATADASGNVITTTYATKTELGAKANTADLGALATKDTVSATEIDADAVTTEKILDANVTKAKLASDIQTSLGKADSALQQADLADYAKTAEVASTYETKENAASTYETKANASATYETKANASATYETKTNAAATYATKEEIKGMATDANLAKKQDKTDNSLATTNKTVVGAINEVKTTADGASTAASAAQSAAATAQSAAEAAQEAADSKLATATYNSQVGTVSAENMGTTAKTVVTAIKEVAGEASTAQSTATQAQQTASQAQQTASQAQQTANAAIPAPSDACADSANKCVLVSSGAGNYSWEVIARGSAE